MKPLAKLAPLLFLLSLSLAIAQPAPSVPGASEFTQAELDQMLAPIALYPDPLLSQVLMAATYPLEVVEAAHWSKANPDLDGERAVQAALPQSWDASVKSLVAFPRVLRMMEEQIGWTQRLGDAFLYQQSQVMDTVQNLRQRALAAGGLRSDDAMRVESQGQTIMIAPADPRFVYVPYYDPNVVYGSWWWPGYPPVYWAPWPGYYARPGFMFEWGVGIAVGAGFFFGDIDWHRHHVNVRPGRGGRPNVAGATAWQHDPLHRRGLPYRPQSRPSPPVETRRDFRGYAPAEPRGGPAIRPQPPPIPRPDGVHRLETRPPAFESVDRGGEVRDSSRRGRASSQETRPAKRPEPRPAGRDRDGKR